MPKMVSCPECGSRGFFYAPGGQETIICELCGGRGDVTETERAAWIAQWVTVEEVEDDQR